MFWISHSVYTVLARFIKLAIILGNITTVNWIIVDQVFSNYKIDTVFQQAKFNLFAAFTV